MTARLTLALLVVIPAAMGYPWHTPTQRWVLGIAVAVVLLALAWWRGTFLTTTVARRLTVWRRNRGASGTDRADGVTVVLAVAGRDLPLEVVGSYVERYGVRCAQVRVTSVDAADVAGTWISITVRAEDNLAALAARSSELPLSDTAEIVGRRLSDHLRELGVETAVAHEAPRPWTAGARETWRGMRDDDGYLVAYAIPADDALPERFEQVRDADPRATWTALEFAGTAARPTVAAVAAFRVDEPPKGAPVPGLVAVNGRHRVLLTALDPLSVTPIDTTLLPRACVSAGDTPRSSTTSRTLARATPGS